MAGNFIEMSTLLWKGQFDNSQLNLGLKSAQSQVEGLNTKFGGLSSFMSKTLMGGVLGLSGGLASMAGVGIKSAVDLQSAMKNFQAQTGLSADETDKVKNAVKNMFVATGESYTDLAKMAQDMHNQLGMGADDIQKYGTQWVKFSKLTKQSDDETIQSIAGIRNAWHLSNDNIQPLMDKLILSQQKYGLAVTDSEQSLKSLAPAFQAAHMNINQGIAYLDLFKKAGLDSSSAAIAFNTALRKVKSPEELQKIITKMQNTKDDSERARIAIETFGKQGLTMSAALKPGTDSIQSIQKALEGATGATDKASKALAQGNIIVELAKIKRSGQDLLEGVGEKALPTMQTLLDSVNSDMPNIQNAISKVFNFAGGVINTFSSTIKFAASNSGLFIPVIAGLAGAIGTLKVATTVTGLLNTFKDSLFITTLATKGLSAALIANPIGLWVAGIGLAVAGGVALYNHLKQKAIPAINLFGKETSDATKKAVNGYMDLDDKATKSLMDLEFSSKKVSKDTANSLAQTFNDMGTQIKTGLDKHFNDDYVKMQDFFSKSTALSAGEEQKILKNMKKGNDDRKQIVDNGTKQIDEILENASNQHRSLSANEEADINKIEQKMKSEAVHALSDTELESKSILERMKAQASNLTAQQAAEVAKNSIDQKNKAVQAANDQYNAVVKEIIRQRDETHKISADQASKLIKDAKNQHDETVRQATDTCDMVIFQAQKQAKGHVDQVNWETGQVKSKWQIQLEEYKKNWTDIFNYLNGTTDKVKNKLVSTWSDIQSNTKNHNDLFAGIIFTGLDNINSHWNKDFDLLNSITNGKFGTINKTIQGKMNNIYNTVADWRKSLQDAWNKLWDFKMPHIKMPHFSISGKFGLNPLESPVINVKWYAKGGIFNSPQIVGVGDAPGGEAVLPLDKLNDIIYNALKRVNIQPNKQPQSIVNKYYFDKLVLPDVQDASQMIDTLDQMAKTGSF